MATFPAYAHVQFRGAGEQPTPVVVRSEMERGIPKQRRIAADTLVQVPVTLLFRTQADATDFEDWFYDEVDAGAAWFDWVNPRTGATVQARIVGGDIGRLDPLSNSWAYAERSLVLEYVRSTL